MSPTRRSMLAATTPALAAAVGLTPSAGTTRDDTQRPAHDDPVVRHLVERATLAHAALMRGEIERYRGLAPLGDDFTLMSPFGGPPSRGNAYTRERWESIGRFFRNGRASTLELVEAYRGTDLVTLAVIERTEVGVGGLPEQPWSLRVTLVYRHEGDRWLLVHRHADPLAPGIGIEQAAELARGPARS